jgi:hypothetical protein
VVKIDPNPNVKDSLKSVPKSTSFGEEKQEQKRERTVQEEHTRLLQDEGYRKVYDYLGKTLEKQNKIIQGLKAKIEELQKPKTCTSCELQKEINRSLLQELNELKKNVLITRDQAEKGRKKKLLDEWQIAQIQHEKANGESVRGLARKYGVSPATIVNYTKGRE